MEMIAGPTLLPDVASCPTVSVTYLRGVLDFAVTRGVRRAPLLLRTGLRERDLLIDDARIPVDRLIAVMRSAADLCCDPGFALHFGDDVPCEQVSLAAPLAQAATTITGAMALLNRYARLGFDFPALGVNERFLLEADASGVWLRDWRPPDAWPEITESLLARMARGVRRVAARDVLRAVYVTHPEPAHRAVYDAIFSAPIHFGTPHNALLMDGSYLQIMLTPAPPHLTRTRRDSLAPTSAGPAAVRATRVVYETQRTYRPQSAAAGYRAHTAHQLDSTVAASGRHPAGNASMNGVYPVKVRDRSGALP